MTVFCDNDGCMFSDGCGFCDCDKLSIVGGVCAGSYRSGRNVCDGDVDERLKAENAKLRELIADVHESLCADKAGMFHKLILASMEDDMRELRVEVSND